MLRLNSLDKVEKCVVSQPRVFLLCQIFMFCVLTKVLVAEGNETIATPTPIEPAV